MPRREWHQRRSQSASRVLEEFRVDMLGMPVVVLHDMKRQGLSISAIARATSLNRKSVRKYLRWGVEILACGPRDPRPRLWGSDEDYLRERGRQHAPPKLGIEVLAPRATVPLPRNPAGSVQPPPTGFRPRPRDSGSPANVRRRGPVHAGASRPADSRNRHSASKDELPVMAALIRTAAAPTGHPVPRRASTDRPTTTEPPPPTSPIISRRTLRSSFVQRDLLVPFPLANRKLLTFEQQDVTDNKPNQVLGNSREVPLDKAFQARGVFRRGNLHGHSSNSDGTLHPEAVCKLYRDQGYDFISVTDHFRKVYGYPVTDTRAYRDEAFTTIPGAELHAPRTSRGAIWHILAVGLPLDFAPPSEVESGPELAQRASDAGAFVAIAHPHWYQLQIEDGEALQAANAVEVYNHTSQVNSDRGDGLVFYDAMLSRGHQLHCIAVDDSHIIVDDTFGGWVMVKSEQNTPEAILAALKAGEFYSSQGARNSPNRV